MKKAYLIITLLLVITLITAYFIYEKGSKAEKIKSEKISDYDIPIRKTKDTYNLKLSKNRAKVFKYITKKYGPEIAKNVERIFRLETAHFTSGGWKNTLSAGMHPFLKKFPYGWNSKLWKEFPRLKPVSVYYSVEGGTGKKKPYLVFDNDGGFWYLAEYIKRNKNPARWFSIRRIQQAIYMKKLKGIKTEYT